MERTQSWAHIELARGQFVSMATSPKTSPAENAVLALLSKFGAMLPLVEQLPSSTAYAHSLRCGNDISPQCLPCRPKDRKSHPAKPVDPLTRRKIADIHVARDRSHCCRWQLRELRAGTQHLTDPLDMVAVFVIVERGHDGTEWVHRRQHASSA